MAAAIWEDETGKVFVSYNDPIYQGKRHRIADQKDLLNKLEESVKAILAVAVAAEDKKE